MNICDVFYQCCIAQNELYLSGAEMQSELLFHLQN